MFPVYVSSGWHTACRGPLGPERLPYREHLSWHFVHLLVTQDVGQDSPATSPVWGPVNSTGQMSRHSENCPESRLSPPGVWYAQLIPAGVELASFA